MALVSLSRDHMKKPSLGCINTIMRDTGSRGDAIQKLNRICFKYIKESDNFKKSRKRNTRRLESNTGIGMSLGN